MKCGKYNYRGEQRHCGSPEEEHIASCREGGKEDFLEEVTPEGSPVALGELSPHHRVDEVCFTQGLPVFRASRAEWQEQGRFIVKDEVVQVSRRQAPRVFCLLVGILRSSDFTLQARES